MRRIIECRECGVLVDVSEDEPRRKTDGMFIWVRHIFYKCCTCGKITGARIEPEDLEEI